MAIPIPYNIDDDSLYELLDRINGAHMTGGELTLIDIKTGEQHSYYKTAKKIFEYSKRLKDD